MQEPRKSTLLFVQDAAAEPAALARAMVSSCFWPEEMDEVSLPMTVS